MTNLTAPRSRPAPTSTSDTTSLSDTTSISDAGTRAARLGARFGAGAAVTWGAFGLESILRPHVCFYRDALWVVPWVLTYCTFWFLNEAQRARTGAKGERIFKALTVGMILTGLGGIGVFFDIDALKLLGFPLGALLWLVVMVFFGLSTMKAGVLRKRAGVAIILLEPCSMLFAMALSPIAPIADRGAYSGATEKGAVIGFVAYELWRVARRGRR